MKNYNITIRELILTNEKKAYGCETFTYEPSNIEEEPLGTIHIIGLVKSKKEELEFLPNLVASIARREFYKLTDTNPETSFETCLKKVNASILEIEKEHRNIRKHVSFCIINISKNKMRFSYIGEHFMYMLRDRSPISTGGKKEGKNLFSAVVTGNIELDDRFIFATAELGDLFSKKSIGKILEYDIDKQAETIHKLYEERAREIPQPAQAAILFNVSDKKIKKTLKSVFGMTRKIQDEKISRLKEKESKQKEVIQKHKLKIISFLKEKKFFISALVLLVLAASGGSFFFKVHTAQKIFEEAKVKISEADQKATESKEDALSILNDVKGMASIINTYPLFSEKAKSLENEVNKKENEINGIFNITTELERFGKITGKSFEFEPKFIFESQGNIYVFGDYLNSFYKIAKGENSGSFNFLEDSTFEPERAFKDEYGVYFINYLDEEVHKFDVENEVTEQITDPKITRQLLRLKPTVYNKDYDEINYNMEENHITKTIGEEIKYFNFLTLIRIKDFTISDDRNSIYILSEREVFRTDNR